MDGTIYLWSTRTGFQIRQWQHGEKYLTTSKINIIDGNDNYSRSVIENPKRTSVAISPNNKLVATGSFADKTISIWDITEGKELAQYFNDEGVINLRFIDEGKNILSVCWNGSMNIWKLPEF